MRRLAILGLLALAVVPAAALADNPPSQTQSPAQQCKAQRTSIGVSAFNQLYGTSTNAFGKCVSHQTQADAQAEASAASSCKSEQVANADAFATKYGKSHNAFGKCVSQKSQSTEAQNQQATISAARTCRNDQKADVSAFNTKYGTAKNAFGKCVSAHSKKS